MKLMAIGLGADAAVAKLEVGIVEQALMGLGEALTEMEGFAPKTSLRAAYCHHVLRHIVLWFTSRIEDTAISVGGAPISMVPGCCSNPDPHASFADRPVGSADIAWYMLAKLDVISRSELGYVETVGRRMGGLSIPPQEFELRAKLLIRSIQDLDCEGFAGRVWGFVESGISAFAYLRRAGSQFNVFEPEFVGITKVPSSPLDEKAESLLDDAVIAFAISCACKHSAELLPRMCEATIARLGGDVSESEVLSVIIGAKPPTPTFKTQLILSLMLFQTEHHPSPREYCASGVRALQHADQSHMKGELIRMIAAWQRAAWTRIVASETFRLARPRLSVPEIEIALALPKDNDQFLCTLFLATVDATDVSLPTEMCADYRSRSGIATA
jgi:hypothetical protein